MTTELTTPPVGTETRILVIRNDKLGDFMLAWPAFALLKHYWPELHITALVPNYTAPAAELCPFIDEILIDPQDQNVFVLSKSIKEAEFDAMLTLFSTTRIAVAGILSRIPYRLAPATKIAQLFYTNKLTQRRSLSKKPEYLYNIDLAVQFLIDFKKVSVDFALNTGGHDCLPTEICRPLLNLGDNITSVKEKFMRLHNLPQDSKMVFIHPGSGGSAANLSTGQFANLADQIEAQARRQVCIVICAGPEEKGSAESLQRQHSSAIRSCIYHSIDGFEQFVKTLQIADLFISGSTGTLHVAGVLNIPTVGFYPTKRSSTSLRWQTLSSPKHRLEFSLPGENDKFDAERIAKVIVERMDL
jgi:ADP-heptose:LPS heptosyltransferase